jgi:aryl-alcohol dehydrogenase-like predicted oxidoreductase
MVELAIGWLVAQPTVGSVIAGASSPEQVGANAAAAGVALDADVLEAVDLAAPGPVR